jgi:hypothetical protein
MNCPSWFFSGTTISSPGAKSRVQAVPAFSTRSRWSRQTKCRWSFLTIAPGSRCDSHRIWKPLQIPSTGSPPRAASTTLTIIGANREIAPARR